MRGIYNIQRSCLLSVALVKDVYRSVLRIVGLKYEEGQLQV